MAWFIRRNSATVLLQKSVLDVPMPSLGNSQAVGDHALKCRFMAGCSTAVSDSTAF